MNFQEISVILGSITIISATIGVFIANSKNKFFETQKVNYESTIQSYQDVIDSLKTKNDFYEKEIKELRVMHTENVQQIGELKGELKSYRELPLKEIAENQKVITTVQLLIAEHLKVDGVDDLIKKLAK